MISPSRSACSGLAFRTVCLMPRLLSCSESTSDTSTEMVPTSTGWPASWRSCDLVGHGRPLAVLGLVDLVVLVGADHGLVGGHLDHLELVDLHELGGLGERGAGHAAELVVAAEVVLVGDRGDGLVLLLDRHALLRLDGLVEPLRPAPALEDAAGELVDDLDLAVDHGVVHVALVERLGLQRLLEVVDHVAVLGAVEVVDA